MQSTIYNCEDYLVSEYGTKINQARFRNTCLHINNNLIIV
jgi:hypothetical protein